MEVSDQLNAPVTILGEEYKLRSSSVCTTTNPLRNGSKLNSPDNSYFRFTVPNLIETFLILKI